MSDVQKKVTLLQAMRGHLERILPAHVPVEKFIQIGDAAFASVPALNQCNPGDLTHAFLKAARDGLLPDGREAVIVPRYDKDKKRSIPAYQPMAAGIMRCIRRSPSVQEIAVNIVYQNEMDQGRFDMVVSDGESKLVHRPIVFGEKGEPVGVYAMVRTTNGGIHVETLDKNEIEKIEKSANKKGFSPWKGDFYLEMWKKSAIHRLNKRFKIDDQVDQLARRVEEHYPEFSNVPPPQIEESSSKLLEVVEKKQAEDGLLRH